MELIERPGYSAWLDRWRDKDMIKVLTGVRRCGKSTLLKMLANQLRTEGVPKEQIIELNLENPEFKGLLSDPTVFYSHVVSQLAPGKINYVFIDEIQRLTEFERAADGLFIRDDVDLYLTGSNADLLSGELATLLGGRYVELPVQPFSFSEYLSARLPKGTDLFSDLVPRAQLFSTYLRDGSFPMTLMLDQNQEAISEYLEGLLNTILLKDVSSRNNFRDLAVLRMLVEYLADNVGNLISARKISGALTSMGTKVSTTTIQRYLVALESAFIFYRVERFDIRGKQILESQQKYYIVDPGLRRHLLGSLTRDTGRLLENIVYLELRRRGYQIRIGTLGATEVDFIAKTTEGTLYVQVAETVRNPDTLERELAPLRQITDFNQRLLLTLDEEPPASHNGIRQVNALEWLLQGS
jgi:predicted AAA+ superfamily ATPase